jgi:hypothetical protein
MNDDRDFPPIDSEQARSLLAVAYQGIRTALGLNAELAARLADADDEARRLNDAVFVALDDVRQRLEAVIGRAG